MQFNTTSQEVCKVGEYTFRVLQIGNPRHIQIWYDKKVIGTLVTDLLPSGWSRVKVLNIKEEHRSRGLGRLLYQVLFALMPTGEKGITENIKERRNTVQIPKLFARFGGYMDGDTVYIPKDGFHEI